MLVTQNPSAKLGIGGQALDSGLPDEPECSRPHSVHPCAGSLWRPPNDMISQAMKRRWSTLPAMFRMLAKAAPVQPTRA